MALRSLFVWRRFRPLLVLFVVWAAVLYGYEFKYLKRPALSEAGRPPTTESKAVPFLLKNVSFPCASQYGFVTSVQVSDDEPAQVSDVRCETSFTEATTRCASGLPMTGFGDRIHCAEPEAIHCHGGPLQVIGLFNDDSFCGDVSDMDPGPPQESTRAED